MSQHELHAIMSFPVSWAVAVFADRDGVSLLNPSGCCLAYVLTRMSLCIGALAAQLPASFLFMIPFQFKPDVDICTPTLSCALASCAFIFTEVAIECLQKFALLVLSWQLAGTCRH